MIAEPAADHRTETETRPALAALADADRLDLDRRRRLVIAWQNLRGDFAALDRPRADALRSFLAAHPDLHRSTLYAWAAAYRADGDAGLLDHRRRPAPLVGAASSRDPVGAPSSGDPVGAASSRDSCSPDAWSLFKQLYLAPQRRSVALCHQIVAHEAAKNDWPWPGLRAIQRRAHTEIPPFESDFFRLGEREWRRRHEPKIRRDYGAYRSNEWWVADFHEFDVFCRRSDSDATICRPLLSGFIDLRSRFVVGWHITERECQDSLLLAFRAAVTQYGPPRHAVIDNGKPYRALGVSGGRPTTVRLVNDEDYVRSVLGGLGIAVHFAIPFNPDSKLIERWFRTLEMQFGAAFESYCGGQRDDRFAAAWRLAHDHPEHCPTVAELAEKFARYLDAYHATPHTGAGMDGLSPAEAFGQFDPIPRGTAPQGALDLLVMRPALGRRPSGDKGGPRKPYIIRRSVIVHHGVEYGWGDPRVSRLNGKAVVLRIDPADASFVVVCDLEGRPLFRAINRKLELTGLTQDDLAAGMRAKAHARRLAKKVMEGATRPMIQDVATAAIDARLAAGRGAALMDKLAAATGTDAIPTRNVAPLRGDWADAVRSFQASELQRTAAPPTDRPMRTLQEMLDAAGDDPKPEPPPKRTLADVVDEWREEEVA